MYAIVDTTGQNEHIHRVQYYTYEAAAKHAKFLNDRDERNGEV